MYCEIVYALVLFLQPARRAHGLLFPLELKVIRGHELLKSVALLVVLFSMDALALAPETNDAIVYTSMIYVCAAVVVLAPPA